MPDNQYSFVLEIRFYNGKCLKSAAMRAYVASKLGEALVTKEST